MNLKQLSNILGLSQTTVSRALNGFPEVSETTRQRVQMVADQYGYSPNTRAKSLATGRSMAIGHVIPVSEKHEMVNPVFGDFIAGAGESYARHGYDMHLSLFDHGSESDIYTKLKMRRSVDGVVVHGPQMDDPRIDLLRKLDMPFVVHGRSSNQTGPYSWVDVNSRSSFEQATSYLLDLGHKRIGLINGYEIMDFAYRRRTGYETALKTWGVAVDPALMRSDEMTEAHGYRSARDILNLSDPPTAFLCSSMICALGTRRAIEDSGQKMGRDISVITHDDCLSYLQTDGDIPVFTSVKSSVRNAGRCLGDMLIHQINTPTEGPVHKLLEAELTVGTSTGPAPL
ncbi:LacI family DNA-binding transcriptional regulator [Aestuariibius sp. HNIBRBA575]|uniref:LacI family DNA-binding transcriptional regulator n=1 Tax=Aestuariibius sp. HNIBRBA575 TaxID=3233343 RepID=UPI0034A35D67